MKLKINIYYYSKEKEYPFISIYGCVFMSESKRIKSGTVTYLKIE